MLTLIVAQPRTGKSQFAVSKMFEHRAEGKRVFVTNFNQTPQQRETLGVEEFTDYKEWWEKLPHGAVWIIDEAQDIFPQRVKTELPEWIKLFSKHGHHDLTIYVITQDAMQLDVHLRRNSNFTLYMTRPLNMSRALIYTFRGYQEIPNDAWRRSQVLKTAESKKKFAYKKKYQDAYVSASAHEHIKKRFPIRLFVLLPILVLIVGGLLWFAWGRLKKDSTGSGTTAAVAAAAIGADAPADAAPQPALSLEQYQAKFKPRIDDVPWSAPAYDGFEVTDYPRPYCYRGRRGCRCFTQQGSRLKMTVAQCDKYIEEGYFDPFKKEASTATYAGAGQGPAGMPTAPVGASSPAMIPSQRQVSGYGASGLSQGEPAPVGDFSMR